METEITIGSLTLKEKDAGWVVYDINELLKQISENARKITFKDLVRIQKDGLVTCFAVKRPTPDKPIKIIGMGSIHFVETFVSKKGFIEDLIVDKEYQGKGIRKKIIKLLMLEAKKEKTNLYQFDLMKNEKT